ncbi:hypothetical protein [Blautia sp.]|nr:hypothetical protein [Blautia sp.]
MPRRGENIRKRSMRCAINSPAAGSNRALIQKESPCRQQYQQGLSL